MNILVAKNGSQLGPFSESDLRAKLSSGEFAPTDFGWKDGMASWAPLSQILPDAAPSPSPAPKPQGALSPASQMTPPASSPLPSSSPSFYNPSLSSANVPASGNKQQYLAAMRANTAYPTYRGTIGTIAFLGYILAGLQVLMAFGFAAAGYNSNGALGALVGLVFGLVAAALSFLLARFGKEAATIIADIGDSITEANSRGR